PPCLNALGQGNGELLVVALVAISAQLAARTGRLSEIFSLLSLGLSALLKIYPAVAFGVLALYRRRSFWKTVVAAALVALWCLANFSEIRAVVARTPRPFYWAF